MFHRTKHDLLLSKYKLNHCSLSLVEGLKYFFVLTAAIFYCDCIDKFYLIIATVSCTKERQTNFIRIESWDRWMGDGQVNNYFFPQESYLLVCCKCFQFSNVIQHICKFWKFTFWINSQDEVRNLGYGTKMSHFLRSLHYLYYVCQQCVEMLIFCSPLCRPHV